MDGSATSAPGSRIVARGLLRAATTCAVMVAAYYIVPLRARSYAAVFLELVIGIGLLSAIIAWQLRAILLSTRPGIRAAQTLATATPLFLLLFASTYYILAGSDSGSFSEPLSRSDALYFTMTIFASVGFGDITAQTEVTRLLVTGQMLLDLVLVGLGLQVLLGAVRRARST